MIWWFCWDQEIKTYPEHHPKSCQVQGGQSWLFTWMCEFRALNLAGLSQDEHDHLVMSCWSCSWCVWDLDQKLVSWMKENWAAFPLIRIRARKRTLLMSWAVNSIESCLELTWPKPRFLTLIFLQIEFKNYQFWKSWALAFLIFDIFHTIELENTRTINPL